MKKLDKDSLNLVKENIEKLKEIFPDIFSEGKIDFEKLRENLGEFVEEEEEKYQFTWFGKKNANKIALTPTNATLRPAKNESKNWDKTKNIYIEGDNLEVLKVLQKAYYKKIKMIYIDPPYNTGKDFIYKDNFYDNLKNYLTMTNQVDEEGNPLSLNSEKSGRKHSNWLNMMYPRLKLARNLLKDDGVIFISIDDNEVHNLRKICDEIFGEENFVNNFVWINNTAGRQIQGYGAASTKEYILCYAKNIDKINEFLIEGNYVKQVMPDMYKGFNYEIKEDNIGKYIITHELNNGNSAFNENTRPNLIFDIFYNPTTKEVKTGDVNSEILKGFIRISPKKISNSNNKYYAWRWSREKIEKEFYDLDFIENNGEWKVFTKRRNFDKTILKDIITNIITIQGSNELNVLDMKKFFDYPKSIKLIKIFLKIITNSNDIILDFFSGSATTAHAVMELNAEDGGNRQFILVQLPEPTDPKSEAYKAGYKNICEIGKERIRRAGEQILKSHSSPLPPKTSNLNPQTSLDLGFKVFKLDSTNIKEWDSNPQNLEENILNYNEFIKSDRSEEDLLYEILLKYGIDLTTPIEIKKINEKKIYIVGFGSLFIYFDEIDINIAKEIVELVKEYENEFSVLVLKDDSFISSSDKVNIIEFFKQMNLFEKIVSL